MKTPLAMMLMWASALAAPVLTLAQVDIHIGIGLPPPFVFEAPPEVVVIPDTSDVYAVPDVRWRPIFLGWLVVEGMGRALVSLPSLQRGVGVL